MVFYLKLLIISRKFEGFVLALFSTHINAAVVSSGFIIVPLHSSGFINVNESLGLLFIGIVSGVLPDIDSDNSKPVKYLFRFISIIIPLILLLIIDKKASLLYMILLWGLSGVILDVLFFKIILDYTKHRGIFHSIPMAILMGEIGFLLFEKVFGFSSRVATFGGFFVFYGYMIHLILDEIYSVNALGFRLKNSFGSALKLFSRDNLIGTFFVYTFIGIFWYNSDIDLSVLEKFYEIFKNIKFI